MRALPLLFLLCAACAGTTAGDRAPSGPNVVLIMTDDQGWGDFGFHGNPLVATPNLDAMARCSARIVGLLPMAVFGQTEEGSISYVGLSIAVAGGLAFCTIFTAFAVPMAYTFADDFSAWLRGTWQRALGTQTTGHKAPR